VETLRESNQSGRRMNEQFAETGTSEAAFHPLFASCIRA
jgi:hypothetical protein